MENVYTVHVGGVELSLYSTESEDYTNSIAQDVDAKIKEIMGVTYGTATTSAAILAAMDYCDEIRKMQEGTDNLRAQIKEYMDDANKAIAERDEARRIIEQLKNELLAVKVKDLAKK